MELAEYKAVQKNRNYPYQAQCIIILTQHLLCRYYKKSGNRMNKDGGMVRTIFTVYDPLVETTGTVAIENDLLVFIPDES